MDKFREVSQKNIDTINEFVKGEEGVDYVA
jgi:hypothetical protein